MATDAPLPPPRILAAIFRDLERLPLRPPAPPPPGRHVWDLPTVKPPPEPVYDVPGRDGLTGRTAGLLRGPGGAGQAGRWGLGMSVQADQETRAAS